MSNPPCSNIGYRELVEHSPRLCVAHVNRRYGVYAVESIAPGQILMEIEGERRDHPSRFSIQVEWNVHIHANRCLNLEELINCHPWRFLNHSCDANTMVRGNCLVAVRLIGTGEEVTFNYNATEYEMAYPFTCRCGSPFCTHEIRGFKYLAPKEQERLRPLLNAHLQSLPNLTRIKGGNSDTP